MQIPSENSWLSAKAEKANLQNHGSAAKPASQVPIDANCLSFDQALLELEVSSSAAAPSCPSEDAIEKKPISDEEPELSNESSRDVGIPSQSPDPKGRSDGPYIFHQSRLCALSGDRSLIPPALKAPNADTIIASGVRGGEDPVAIADQDKAEFIAEKPLPSGFLDQSATTPQNLSSRENVLPSAPITGMNTGNSDAIDEQPNGGQQAQRSLALNKATSWAQNIPVPPTGPLQASLTNELAHMVPEPVKGSHFATGQSEAAARKPNLGPVGGPVNPITMNAGDSAELVGNAKTLASVFQPMTEQQASAGVRPPPMSFRAEAETLVQAQTQPVGSSNTIDAASPPPVMHPKTTGHTVQTDGSFLSTAGPPQTNPSKVLLNQNDRSVPTLEAVSPRGAEVDWTISTPTSAATGGAEPIKLVSDPTTNDFNESLPSLPRLGQTFSYSVLPLAEQKAELRQAPNGNANLKNVVIGQASQAILQAVTLDRAQTTELTLAPEELGKLRFEITIQDDQTSIRVFAERPETLDLLKRHSEILSAELRQTGLSQGHLSFGNWSQRSSSARQHLHDNEPAVQHEKTQDTPQVMILKPHPTSGRLHIRL